FYVSSPAQVASYNVATSQTATAVVADARIEAGIGVHATGGQYGVYAFSEDDMSTAGYFSAPLDSDSAGTGVYAEGYPGITAKTYAQNAFAGQFIGNVSVSGNLSKAGGSFKIDDPID